MWKTKGYIIYLTALEDVLTHEQQTKYQASTKEFFWFSDMYVFTVNDYIILLYDPSHICNREKKLFFLAYYDLTATKNVVLFDVHWVEFRKSEALWMDQAIQIPNFKYVTEQYYMCSSFCEKTEAEESENMKKTW